MNRIIAMIVRQILTLIIVGVRHLFKKAWKNPKGAVIFLICFFAFLTIFLPGDAEKIARFINRELSNIKSFKGVGFKLEGYYFVFPFFGLVLYFISKVIKKVRVQLYIKNSKFSPIQSNYTLKMTDYERNNEEDRLARKCLQMYIMELQGGACICGEKHNGYDLDHLMIPKSEGGNFVLVEKNTGAYVANVVGLCQKCNRSKGTKDYREFFSYSQIKKITEVQKKLTEFLNSSGCEYNL